ncbi:MAG: DUF5991 domain-containing protein [Syntrophomonadaceae bacterium]|nr:DUF5991 domain-containing protein [Syntrophomonadaceae bacterium]
MGEDKRKKIFVVGGIIITLLIFSGFIIKNYTLKEDELKSWVGYYALTEHIKVGVNRFLGITIYKKDGGYYAKINIDGYQSLTRLQAKVHGDKNQINLIFDKYLPDHKFATYEKGELLIRFEKQPQLITVWGAIETDIPKYKIPGEYFKMIKKGEPSPEIIMDYFENNQDQQAYWLVLKSQLELVSTEEHSYKYLNEFDYERGNHRNEPWKVFKFAVVDLDGDGYPEILLDLLEQIEVLHYEYGTVLGYCFPIVGIKNLKTDGTFDFSTSDVTGGYGRLIFPVLQEKYELIKLGEFSYSIDEEGKHSNIFYIDEEPVSEDIYRTFGKEQEAKEDVIWYEFTDENIDAMLK